MNTLERLGGRLKLKLRLSAIASALVLAAGAGMAFAGPAAASPGGNILVNVAGYGKLWWSSDSGRFSTSHSHNTPLLEIKCTHAGNPLTCELQLPNGLCMTWNQSADNRVGAISCRKLASQYWIQVELANGDFRIENEYGNSYYHATAYLVSPGSGREVYLATGTPGTNAEWIPTAG
jgi:hypothetical protein